MSLDARTTALGELQELGLLASYQRLAALSHPRLAELADQPSPQATLEWLLRAEVVDAQHLLEAAERQRRGMDAEALAARRALVLETLRRINQDSVDALLAEALIPQPVHQVISESLLTDRALLTPAATMALVMQVGMLPWADYQALQARPAGERSAAANAILAETAALIEQRTSAARREFWDQLLPGPRWMYIVGAPLALGAVIWYNIASNAAPGCDSEEARKTVNVSMLMSSIRSGARNFAMARPAAPTLTDAREVGYNKVQKVRACSAQLDYSGVKSPFNYLIEPNTDKQEGGFTLRGVQAEILKARFDKLGDNGDFLQQAEPIGRVHLNVAFRAAMATMGNDAGDANRDAMRNTMRALRGEARDSTADPKRDSDIEPVGACRAIKEGASYSCPLLVEWENPLMAAIGYGGSQMLRGDFTFERDAADAAKPWRASADFAEQFMQARRNAVKDAQDEDKAAEDKADEDKPSESKPAKDAVAPAAR